MIIVRMGAQLRALCKREEQNILLSVSHDSPWVGCEGTWVMFVKLKGKYWWLGLYKDVS